ncbi:lytic transglycosylase domain-containing protein [Canibacter sp. lx-72]|uniref:lytic transglycosylase domain-containing protein n=1 Tax=Canibacter zhuwentaonis TaxID=2837491 RepID=UPI001BDBF9D1|nr:lytic transglycosylase domain-containing protein [Canibacter zhuwentaonis]MBT1018298.1 lytic transglycosylase domain-containing protein [Canibacter zhuwentaonis]
MTVLRNDKNRDGVGLETSEIETHLGVQFKTEPISTGFNFERPPKDSIITPAVRSLITVCVVGLALLVIVVGVITLVNIAQLRAEKAAQEEEAKASEEVKISPEPVGPAESLPKSELAAADVKKADVDWVRATAASANISVTALEAYASAALTLEHEKPNCGIGWNTLAAIGQVETAHGTIDGAQLDSTGRAYPRIIGVALDGSRFTATPDTDAGRYDNDRVWDRAVGPMQFTPETWEKYKRDGNGDGKIDIDNIYDQSLAAATLLCTIGGDLRDGSNWIRAIAAYNPSVAYNNNVAEVADRYAAIAAG